MWQKSVTDGQKDGQTTDKVNPMCRYASQATQKVHILRRFHVKIAMKRRALCDVIMLLLMTSLSKKRETGVKSVM